MLNNFLAVFILSYMFLRWCGVIVFDEYKFRMKYLIVVVVGGGVVAVVVDLPIVLFTRWHIVFGKIEKTNKKNISHTHDVISNAHTHTQTYFFTHIHVYFLLWRESCVHRVNESSFFIVFSVINNSGKNSAIFFLLFFYLYFVR